MTTLRLAALGAAEWDALVVERCDDVYLRAAYVEAACVLDPGEPLFLRLAAAGGDVLFAGILRRAPAGALDVTTPYGYGGPVATGPEPPVAGFWSEYDAWCHARGVVTSFFRFHPLLENVRHAPPAMRVELLGLTVGWPLADDDLLAGMHPTHRNKVRKALKAGAEVTVREAPPDLAGFAALYEETMERLGASGYYRFPSAYWERMATGLRERLLLLEATIGGDSAGSVLCLVGGRWLHYHLSATAEIGRRAGVANLLLLRAAEWGRERGLEEFHLGGGLGGGEDSLYAFKAHFTRAGRRQMHVGKAVHDPQRYLELTGAAALDLDGYFPAYRRPAAVR